MDEDDATATPERPVSGRTVRCVAAQHRSSPDGSRSGCADTAVGRRQAKGTDLFFRDTLAAVRRLALVLVGVSGARAILEIGLRVASPIAEVPDALFSLCRSDPELGWTGKPNARVRFRRLDFDTVVEQDSAGWRRPDPLPPHDPTRRILFLGDSFTWGWGVGQGEVFTDALQRRVAPGTAVYNRGMTAYGTAQEYLLLRRELATLHYDDVVLMFFANDLSDNLDGEGGRRPLFELVDGRLIPGRQPTALMNPVNRFRKDHSRAFQFFYYHVRVLTKWLGRSAEAPPEVDGPNIDFRSLPGSGVTAKLIAATNQLARQNGARFFVVYVPTASDIEHGAAHDPYVRALHVLLVHVSQSEQIPLIDLAPQFHERAHEGERLIYPRDQHWTPAGHRLAADLLLASPIFAPPVESDQLAPH